jgi:two-component system cell cycle sensor histidine kinase/response regulator CckA
VTARTEDLRASEQRYRHLFLAAKDGVLILDEEGRIVDVNPFMTELTSYSRGELLGKRLWEIGPFRDAAASRSAFDEVRARRYVRYEGLALQALDGRPIDVELVGTSYEVEGRDEIQCTIRDVTARKRAEAEREKLTEQLRVAQRLEAIGILAGGVAQDFNNLLSVILSYTDCAMEASREAAHTRGDLMEVKNAALRAADLTRQLLAFGRRQVLQPVPLNLNRVVTGIEKTLREILGERIDLTQVLALDLGLVCADPGQIELALVNLAANARDAMPRGGKLTIDTSNVQIDERHAARHAALRPGPYVQLTVSDTGCGMDEQTRARIFEPFFTTKETSKGLGLSTAYGIVKQSGGYLSVRSELGCGSTFEVYLPRDLAGATMTASKRPALPQAARAMKVLVVEDDSPLRAVIKRTLEKAGYEVLAATDGVDALRVSAAHSGDIHLLLSDVVMPRMGGGALTQELARSRPALKVLYMSGYHNDAIVCDRVVNAGTPFLSKPFTAADLTRKVREVLGVDTTDPEER